MKTENLTNAEAALLGLLSEEPMHPYKIEQEVKFRDMRFWTDLSMSAIYKLLNKLEKNDLVTRENKVTGENRIQKIYSLSEKGNETLKLKLIELLSEPEHSRWQVDIGVYNSSLLTKNETIKSLSNYRKKLLEKIKGYEDLHAFLKSINCPSHRFELAKRPVYLLKAEIEWLDSFINELK